MLVIIDVDPRKRTLPTIQPLHRMRKEEIALGRFPTVNLLSHTSTSLQRFRLAYLRPCIFKSADRDTAEADPVGLQITE